MNIGKKIRELRKAKHIQQQELAEKVNVSNTHMSLIENQRAKPSPEMIVRVAKALHVPPGELVILSMGDKFSGREDIFLAIKIVDNLLKYLTT